jgi:hypothetical protein
MPKTNTVANEMKIEALTISERQREGRAANAIAEMLSRRLLVPKIFFDSIVPPFKSMRIDVLAIDRAGSGDIHGVEIKLGTPKKPIARSVLQMKIQLLLKDFPAHFRYVALDSQYIDLVLKQKLFAEDGLGRVGVIEVIDNLSDLPTTKVVIQPERFRLESGWIQSFDRFQKRTPADMEIRG